jgi:hypothetical protein
LTFIWDRWEVEAVDRPSIADAGAILPLVVDAEDESRLDASVVSMPETVGES